MDAIKFIEERNRMCNAQAGCAACPGRGIVCNKIDDMAGTNAIDIVEVVEKWAAAHPRKTRQSVFLEKWPEAKLDKDGVLHICPSFMGGKIPEKYRCICSTDCGACRCEFWNQEVE